MPEYRYIASDRSGKKIEGVMNSANEGELRMLLQGKGLRPSRIAESAKLDGGFMGIRKDRLDLREQMLLVRRMRSFVAAEIPLATALDLQYESETDPVLKQVLMTARERVRSGFQLWETLTIYPKLFDRGFVALIRAGEQAKNLEAALGGLLEHLELRKERLSRVMRLFASLSLAFWLAVIAIVSDQNPVSAEGLPWVLLMLLSGAYVIRSYVLSPEGRSFLNGLSLQVPFFGTWFRATLDARMAQAFAVFCNLGLPPPEVFDGVRKVLDHAVFETPLNDMRRRLESGESLSAAFPRHSGFSPLMVRMLTFGESRQDFKPVSARLFELTRIEVLEKGRRLELWVHAFSLVVIAASVIWMLRKNG